MTESTVQSAQREIGAIHEQIAEYLPGDLPIVGFANDLRGDPTSKHHILRTYADFTDVLWVEASGMRKPQLSSSMDRGRIAARLRKAAEGVRCEGGRLYGLSPLSLPLPGNPIATRLNRALYQSSLRRALRQIGLRRSPILWVYTPTVAPYLPGLPRQGVVYHCVDRWWAFSDYDATVMREAHASCCRQADIVFASSAELVEDCREYNQKSFLVRHGVEWEHFAGAALSPPPCPGDIADLKGPILGFFGLIHEWVDQELLVRIADAFPEATVLLIGKVQADVSMLESRPNVRLLGQKSYASLPAYSARFDVALIPFAYNDLTLAVNPIKLREYLSAGLPVVATALPEIQALDDTPMLRTGRTADEHIAGIRYFLSAAPDAVVRRKTALGMVGESWAGRCAAMMELVRQHTRILGSR